MVALPDAARELTIWMDKPFSVQYTSVDAGSLVDLALTADIDIALQATGLDVGLLREGLELLGGYV